ncbi:MAG: hypothetical protein EAZ27_13145 [Cytophagales bacterium]|nr:MAG: hypothetical protein EAZ27_13145 [Cytophagales bacterium]
MAVIFFFSQLFFMFVIFNKKNNLRISIIYSWISVLTVSYVLTELFSLFDLISFYPIISFYILLNCILTYYIYFHKIRINFNLTKFNNVPKIEKTQIIVISIIIFILLFIAIYSSPNNWDSMTYHLGRIAHWQQNQNIEHYPTHISRQLFNPPLTEYLQMQLIILTNNSDYFVNCVQLFSLVCCLLTLSLIIKELGYTIYFQLQTCLICLTIPMVILQATNTKSELTVSFFVIFSLYFLIKTYKEDKIINAIILGLIAGLAFITKSTSYVYIIPLFGLFYFIMLFKNLKKTILFGLIVIFISISIASPIYLRNYNSYGHPLGASEEERKTYTNSEFSSKALISNITKNIYIHVSNVNLWGDRLYFGKQAAFFKQIVVSVHNKINYELINPATTYANANVETELNLENDEDYAGNFLHFILIVITIISIIILFLKTKIQKIEMLILISFIAIFTFFCFYLKWQPWHSRLHTIIFVFSSILITIFLINININLSRFIIIILTIGSFNSLFFNYTRPLISNKKATIFELTRDENMFRKKGGQNLTDLYQIADFINKNKVDSLGLIMGSDSWDYPIYKILKQNNPKIYIDHSKVSEEATPKKILLKNIIIKHKYILSLLDVEKSSFLLYNSIYKRVFQNEFYAIYLKTN